MRTTQPGLLVRSAFIAARVEPCATHPGFILRAAAKTPLLGKKAKMMQRNP
jgi:hypothetical protein